MSINCGRVFRGQDRNRKYGNNKYQKTAAMDEKDVSRKEAVKILQKGRVMQKKIIAGLLSTVLLAFTLTGCQNAEGQTGAGSQSGGQTEETGEAQAGAEESAEADAVEPASVDATGTVYDLGGLSLPICEPGSVSLTYMGNDTWCAGVSYNDGTAVQQEIEKRTGVHIEWDTYSSDVETVLQTRLASMEGLPDMVELPPFDSNVGVDTYSANGVLVPLNDLIDQYAPNIRQLFEKYPALKAMCTSADGNIYALAGWWGDINDYVPDYLYIRQDWLDNLGLEMPETVDELYEVLKAFKEQDANGNGDPNDEIPLATKNGIWQLYYLMTGFGYDTNSLWYVDENSEVHYAAVEKQYKEMLTFLNKCYVEGLISDDLDGTLLTQNITEDKVGIVCHDPADNMASSDDLAMTGNPACDYEFMPVLQADENGTAQMTKRSLTWHYYGITSACENPETAIQWIDYVYASKDGSMLYNYGIEGLTYEYDDQGEIQFTDLVTNNETYTSAFSALRSVGAWPTYFINDSGEAFMKIFEGTKVETACQAAYNNMRDPFPEMLGTAEESEVFTSIWPDLSTYLNEMFTAFVIGTESLDNFDKYVETANSMGMQEVIAVKKAQYERYQEIVGK